VNAIFFLLIYYFSKNTNDTQKNELTVRLSLLFLCAIV